VSDLADGATGTLEPCPACERPNSDTARFCASCGLALTPVSGPGMIEAVADPLVGRVIADRYRILSLLGRGGMGVVYKVEHIHIGKLMAIKLLHGELSRDNDTLKRFKREAEAASHLDHRNTVQVFDFGRDQGLTYLVMEFLDGQDFGWVIKHEGPLDFARAARICAQACSSIGQAHAAGIVHRDVKPENIMIIDGDDAPDMVKVLDFGLAKLRDDGGQTITRAGAIIGTPYYMAPEHIRGEEVDARADIYSLGAVLYKAVAGVPPFWAASPMGVLTKHLTEDLIPPRERASRRDLPPETDAIVGKAMARDPERRYQTMREFRDDLAAYLATTGEELADSAISRPRIGEMGERRVVHVATRGDVDHYERGLAAKGWLGRIVAGLLVVGLVLGGGWWYRHQPAEGGPEREQEPNGDPALANPLAPNHDVRGQLGQRQDVSEGDADVFVIDNPGGERRVMSFTASGLPNMDIAVDVVKAGIPTPVLVADSNRRGGGEAVPNFPLSGSTYYLRVREVREAGAMPTENVSDDYVVRWSFVEPSPEDEHEVNDSLELAEIIELGAPRRGFLGWEGDADLYCAAADGASMEVRLSAVPTLDVVLRVVNRTTATSQRVDAGGLGAPERAELPAVRGGATCFEVSAAAGEGALNADATQQYTLTLANRDAASAHEDAGGDGP